MIAIFRNSPLDLFYKKDVLKYSVKFTGKHLRWTLFFNDTSTTSPEYEENIIVTLKCLRHSHLNNVIFSYLNINSVRNKLGDLDKILDRNIDILCIAETKLDESFTNN